MIERLKKREHLDDPFAVFHIGMYYARGEYGFPQDVDKALEIWHRSGELGFHNAYNNIGYAYDNGLGVKVDEKKANHYYELSAMGGDEEARNNLGNNELRADNVSRALKHYMISVRVGCADSLENIKQMYSDGDATKDDYMKALQLYQEYLVEIKSKQRDDAAAAREDYRYY